MLLCTLCVYVHKKATIKLIPKIDTIGLPLAVYVYGGDTPREPIRGPSLVESKDYEIPLPPGTYRIAVYPKGMTPPEGYDRELFGTPNKMDTMDYTLLTGQVGLMMPVDPENPWPPTVSS